MSMKKSLCFALVALLAIQCMTMARQVTDSDPAWAALRKVAPGEKLVVKLKDGKKIEGRLRAATDVGLTLDRGQKTADVDRRAVAKVYQMVPKSLAKSVDKSAAIGAGTGMAVGAGLGLASGDVEEYSPAMVVIGLALVFGFLGYGIGAIVGVFSGSRQQRLLIYEAK